jgi:Flp pilus assembly pilin Flp
MNVFIKQFFKNLWREEDGQDVVEYALVLGFIGLVAVGGMTTAGTDVRNLWTAVDAKLAAAAS